MSSPKGLKWFDMSCLNSITTTLRMLRSPCRCEAAAGNDGSPAPSQSVGVGVASWAGDSPGAGSRKTANASSDGAGGRKTANASSEMGGGVPAPEGASTSGGITAGGPSGPKWDDVEVT